MAGPGLSVIVHAGGYDRVHYALALAVGAAALGRPVILFLTGRSLTAVLDGNGWQDLDPADDGTSPWRRDADLAARGVGTMDEFLRSLDPLGVRVIACEMGWRALGLERPTLRPDVTVETAGLATLLNASPPGWQILFV